MKKFTNKKGFTIMEMLIVVAIIAVLVAIAIPTMSNSLTKAKEAADVANIRAAYAEIQVKYLTEETSAPTVAITDGKESSSDMVIAGDDATHFGYYLDSKLNDAGNLDYEWDSTNKKGTITYTPDAINNKTAYKWVIEQK